MRDVKNMAWKNIIGLFVIAAFLILPYQAVAVDSLLVSTISVSSFTVFSMEFYTDQNVIYSTTVPFSNVDPTKSIVYPNGRRENDGKSDTGVVCLTNIGAPWHLKVQGVYSEGLPDNAVKFYYAQPWNRNTGNQADGTVTNRVDWLSLPVTPLTVYTSGTGDLINTPYGTLSTFSFAVDPRNLSSERAYTVQITYTMTTTP